MDRDRNQNGHPPRFLTLRMIDAIRDHELSKPLRKMDPHILSLCAQAVTVDDVELTETEMHHAWDKITRMIQEHEAKQPYRQKKSVIILIVLIVLLLATICIATILPWLLETRWNSEQYSLSVKTQETAVWDKAVSYDPLLGNAFITVMQDNAFNVPMPNTIPTGYVLQQTDVINLSDTWMQIVSRYEDGKSIMFIQVDRILMDNGDIEATVEMDDNLIEILEVGALQVALFENLGFTTAKYSFPPYIVEITGNGLSREDLIIMIESTYERNNHEEDTRGSADTLLHDSNDQPRTG